jgi:cob(I)alamin adenosyltransferase
MPFENLISLDEQLQLINTKPEDLEIIMTGRYARQEVIDVADLVTEMREVKHYFSTMKTLARKGFEF